MWYYNWKDSIVRYEVTCGSLYHNKVFYKRGDIVETTADLATFGSKVKLIADVVDKAVKAGRKEKPVEANVVAK